MCSEQNRLSTVEIMSPMRDLDKELDKVIESQSQLEDNDTATIAEQPEESAPESPTILKKSLSYIAKKNVSGIPIALKTTTTKPSPSPKPKRTSSSSPSKPSSPRGAHKSLSPVPKSKIDSGKTEPSLAGKITPTLSQAKRSLEMQFLAKKRRLEDMKREISDKQKPLMEVDINCSSSGLLVLVLVY